MGVGAERHCETGRQGCCKTCGQVRGDEEWQTGALRQKAIEEATPIDDDPA